MKRIALFTAALFLGASVMLTGCGEDAKIVGTNEETYQESKAKMLESVSGDKKSQLEEAFKKLEKTDTQKKDRPPFWTDLDGKTADEIIEKANGKKK